KDGGRLCGDERRSSSKGHGLWGNTRDVGTDFRAVTCGYMDSRGITTKKYQIFQSDLSPNPAKSQNMGLGASPGDLRFSDALDTVNHVLSTEENKAIIGISVSVDTLDAVLQGLSPSIIKIDVEGYEPEIIKGAKNTLRSDGLLAVLMELNGSGNRY